MEPFWEGLGEDFGGFLGDFGWILVVLKGSNFEVEVGSRKSGFKVVKGWSGHRWPEVWSALILIVDQSIIDNVDRRSLKSLIIGRSHR